MFSINLKVVALPIAAESQPNYKDCDNIGDRNRFVSTSKTQINSPSNMKFLNGNVNVAGDCVDNEKTIPQYTKQHHNINSNNDNNNYNNNNKYSRKQQHQQTNYNHKPININRKKYHHQSLQQHNKTNHNHNNNSNSYINNNTHNDNNNSSFTKNQISTKLSSSTTNILSGVKSSLDVNSNTVNNNCLLQNSAIKTTVNKAIVDIERNTSSTSSSEGENKTNNSVNQNNNNCTSWSNFHNLQLLTTSKVNLNHTNVATPTTAPRNYNSYVNNENVTHNEKGLNEIIYKVTNSGRLNSLSKKRVYYKNSTNSNNKSNTDFKCKQQQQQIPTTIINNNSPRTDLINVIVDVTDCDSAEVCNSDIKGGISDSNTKQSNIEKISLSGNICEGFGNTAGNKIYDQQLNNSLNACTAMTTALIALTTTTTSTTTTKASAAIVTSTNSQTSPELAVAAAATTTTASFSSLTSIVTDILPVTTTTTTTTSSSPSSASNSYTLDFLHSVGVQMTGGANLIALKTSMGQTRSNDLLPYVDHTSGNSTGSTTIRNSYNFPHLINPDQCQTSQQQQQRLLSNDVANGGCNSNNNNRNGNYQTQNNHHHHHHQPQQLTIASFLQKELLEEMLIRSNNLSRNSNCNSINNSSSVNTNYNNNTQNYRTGGHQQRCNNYYQSYYRNHPHHQQQQQSQSQQQLSQQNYLTLQHSDFNNNSGCVGDVVARRNSNMENVASCNIQRSHAYLHSYHAGNNNNNNSNRHGNQQHMRNLQQQQTQRNQHKNNPNIPSTQHHSHSKKLNYVSSSASTCSVSSSASCSSSVSSASSTSSQTSANSHRQQKIKTSIESFSSKNNNTNVGSHRGAQHRSQTNHHHHSHHHHHHGNNYHHQKHQYSTAISPTTSQHQNFYNLTYVNTNNVKVGVQKKPTDIPTEELSSILPTGYQQRLQSHYLQQKRIPPPPFSLQPSTSQPNQVFTSPLSMISCSQLDEAAATTAAGSAISVAVDSNMGNGSTIITPNDYDSDSSSVHSATICQQRKNNFVHMKSYSTPSLSLSAQDMSANTPITKQSVIPTHISNNAATPILQTPIDFVYTTILPMSTTSQQIPQQQMQRYVSHQSVSPPHRNEVVSLLNTVQNYNDDELAILQQQQHHQHQLYFAAGKHLTGSAAVGNAGYWSPMHQHTNFYNHSATTVNMLGSPSCTSSTTSLSPRLNEHEQSPLCSTSICPSISALDDELSTGHQGEFSETLLPAAELASLQHQRIAQNSTSTSRSSRIRNQQQQQLHMHALTQQLPPTLSPHTTTTTHAYQIGSPSGQHNLLFPNGQTAHLRPNSCCSASTHDFYTHTPPDRFLARAHLIETKETPSTLLNNSKWDKLSQSIWQKFISSQQTEETFKQKMRLWRYLYIIIKNSYPRYGLYLVGSTISGFGSNSSDVDMCLVSRSTTSIDPRMEALYNLTVLRDCLSKTGDFENFNLIEAKVPILRFRDRVHQLEIDLNFNNCVGIKNTHLLYCYSQLDWRLRPLVLVTKLWAQCHNINNAKNMTISSYSLVLMVIHFLQYAVTPPVLPCLHDKFPDKFPLLRSNDFGYVDMNETIEPYESQNMQSIGELFLSFLEYYSCFDYTQNAISIRTGGLLSINICRQAKSLKNDIHQWKELCIEEPFDLTNTARSVYDYETFERVKSVFIESWHILKETLDLNAIFSPIVAASLNAKDFTVNSVLFNHNNIVDSQIELPATLNANTVNVSHSESYKHDSKINGLIANSKNVYNYNGNGDNSSNHNSNNKNKLSALIS